MPSDVEMAIQYTNQKGITFYLCQGVTKKGKPRYYFTRQPKGEPVEQIPPGYRVTESVNGVVSLSKDVATQVLPAETEAVASAIRRHPKSGDYRVAVKRDRIEVYERTGPDVETLLGGLTAFGLTGSGVEEKLNEFVARNARYAPVLRFILVGTQKRLYRLERMGYGGHGGWVDLNAVDRVEKLAHKMVPRLGTDAFFEWY